MKVRWIGGFLLGAGVSAAALFGSGTAGAAPDVRSPTGAADPVRSVHAARTVAPPPRTARAVSSASVSASAYLPPMPVREGRSFMVSAGAVSAVAQRYVASGGNPSDTARFFFGDLPRSSLDALAGHDLPPEQTRTELGNMVVSGYFGGIWLRDNLRDAPANYGAAVQTPPIPNPFSPSVIAIGLFDAVTSGLTAAAESSTPWIATAAAHASVPVLLALYGYNRGYLDVLLDNPPPGIPSMRNTLQCNGFLDCRSSAFPLETASRYDAALTKLDNTVGLGWLEMAAWSAVLQGATGAGRFVWNAIVAAGSLSPASYTALVELSSAYLMATKTAVLAAMTAAAEGDADTARSALLLEAGLLMWSGSYFAGLASDAPRGTIPTITVN